MAKRDKAKYSLLTYFEDPVSYYYQTILPCIQDARDSVCAQKVPNFIVPSRLVVQASGICNAKCVFCAYRKLDNNHEVMKTSLFEDVASQAKKLGIMEIMFSPTLGENLTDPEFFFKVIAAKLLGQKVEVCTNGVLLSDEAIRGNILYSGIDKLGISIGDIDPATEARVMGISVSAAKNKLHAILELLYLREQYDSDIEISLSFRSKRKFRDIYADMRKNKGWKYFLDTGQLKLNYLHSFDNWAGNVMQDDLLGRMKLGRKREVRKNVCSRLNDIILMPNGDIRLCGCRIKDSANDELVIGNVTKNKLADIITNANLCNFLPPYGVVPGVCTDCLAYCT
jgi:MoaA/NifB/PqqE/SkfB family radical SAM enzyme